MREPSGPVKTSRLPIIGTLAPVSRLTARPWAIAPARLEALLGGIGALTGAGLPWPPEPAARTGYTVSEDGIAVVPVLGPLVARGDWLTALLGATDYRAIASTLAEAAYDPAVRAPRAAASR